MFRKEILVGKMIKKSYSLPLVFIGIAAIVSHFLPSFVKPKKEEVPLNPKATEWRK